MRKNISLLSILFLVFVLSACAAIENNKTQEQEQLLSAAGFKMIPATTQAEIENLNTLTPHKVLFSVKDNKPLYWYADPTNCKCVFTGDQAAYQRYEKLLTQSQIANEVEDAAISNEVASDNMWGWMGGPWGWW
ncbi:MAG: hypothetical protein AAF462_10170 [Thermodesulfobacteriota bacterium]